MVYLFQTGASIRGDIQAMRIAFYSHDTVGLGHIRRDHSIAKSRAPVLLLNEPMTGVAAENASAVYDALAQEFDAPNNIPRTLTGSVHARVG